MNLVVTSILKGVIALICVIGVVSWNIGIAANDVDSSKPRDNLHTSKVEGTLIYGVIFAEEEDWLTIDGYLAPSGTTIFSGQTATTNDKWAVIYVEQFNVNIYIAPQTTLRVKFSDTGVNFECVCEKNFRVEILEGSLSSSTLTISKPYPKILTPLGDKFMEEAGHVVGSTQGNINLSVSCKSPNAPPKARRISIRRGVSISSLAAFLGAIWTVIRSAPTERPTRPPVSPSVP